MSLLVLGIPGTAGERRLYREHREEIRKRLPAFFLEELEEKRKSNETEETAGTEERNGTEQAAGTEQEAGTEQAAGMEQKLPEQVRVRAEEIFSLEDEGILPGLWDFCEALKAGMRVRLRDIPLRQRTVEICEICGEDPYQLESENCILAISREPEALAAAAEESGIPARTIGWLSHSRARLLLYGDEVRYLDRPRRK